MGSNVSLSLSLTELIFEEHILTCWIFHLLQVANKSVGTLFTGREGDGGGDRMREREAQSGKQ